MTQASLVEEEKTTARRSSAVALAERVCGLSCGELLEFTQAILDRPEGLIASAALERALTTARELGPRPYSIPQFMPEVSG